MTSIGYGDIYPLTNAERFTSLFVMIIGATTYASLFGTFVVIIDGINSESRENNMLLDKTLRWAKLRNLSERQLKKITHYYTFGRTTSGYIKSFKMLNNFPMQLKTEITMFIH